MGAEGTCPSLVAWFARIGHSSDSRESAWRAIKIGIWIANDSYKSIRANRIANRLCHYVSKIAQIVVILWRKFPLERGLKGLLKCTIVGDCAHIAESGLKPPLDWACNEKQAIAIAITRCTPWAIAIAITRCTGPESARLHVAALVTTLASYCVWGDDWELAPLVCGFVWSLVMVQDCLVSVLLVDCEQSGLSGRTIPLGVQVCCSRFMLILLRLGGVPLMGGPFGPSVSRSPEVTPQEKAGRPMGPSTLQCTDPWRRW